MAESRKKPPDTTEIISKDDKDHIQLIEEGPAEEILKHEQALRAGWGKHFRCGLSKGSKPGRLKLVVKHSD